MVPIQSRRLVLRNAESILEWWITRLNRGLQNIILMTNRRNGQSVEMKIGGSLRHQAAGACVRIFLRHSMRVIRSRCRGTGVEVLQVILELQDHKVARIHPKVG